MKSSSYDLATLTFLFFHVPPVTSDSRVEGKERCSTACGGFFSQQSNTVLQQMTALLVTHVVSLIVCILNDVVRV